MNSNKPTPIFPQRANRKCPVCQQNSYSASGIHPQCAAARADEPRRLELAAEKKARKELIAAEATAARSE